MADLTTLVIGGVALIPMVFGLVEWSKKLGLTGKALTIASMLIGVFFGALYQMTQLFPVITPYAGVLVVAISAGLAASGIYDFVNARFPRASVK